LDQLADNQRVYVHGPAGSGKTWLAFEKALRWTREGKKVGIVAFNTGLLSYMQNKTTELPENERPAWIGTFHAFATKIGSTAGSPNFYREPVDRYGPALLEAVNKLKNEEKFDAWIIDEAQDFRPNWWEVLMLALRDVERGGMYLFGDDQQMVFGPNSGPQGFFTHFRLFENIRNSQQIAAATESLLKQPVIARGPFSFPIEFIESTYEDAIEKADDVIESLTDKDHWRPGEITLLTTKHQHPVQRELTGLDRAKYWQSLWTGEDVFYCTVGGFKGLERPVVVLAIDGFHDDASENEFLYTGITRARDRLVIVGPKEITNKIQIKGDKG
jgi:superfamily I DNA/RNA helicase